MFAGGARPHRGAVHGRRLLAACALVGALRASAAPAVDATFYDHFDTVALIDQDGQAFRFARLHGKVALVNFVFTGCSVVCPLQTRGLVEVQQALSPIERRGVQFVSVSLDPLADTPPVLKRFAGRMGADLAAWSFVTGPPRDIERVADTLRVLRVDRRAGPPDDHATSLWLVDGTGRVMQRYGGNPPDVARLLREIRALAGVAIVTGDRR